MKKKKRNQMKKKKRNQKELDKISCGSAETFPTQLNREDYFKCPIWFADAPRFVDDLNTASDRYIEASKKTLKKDIDKRNKDFGDKGDMGHVFHSTTLIGDPNFKQLQDYIGATSHNLLGEMGFDLSQYSVFTTEMWVQEFAKKGVTYASHQVNYEVKPGRMIFFPSYMPHQYSVDMGYEPFRFIHWNCQAIPKGVLNV